MKKSTLGIETTGFACAAAIVHGQGIEKGNQGIHGIKWRAATAVCDVNARIVVGHQMGKHGEVGCCLVALELTKGYEGCGSGYKSYAYGEEVGGLCECECARRIFHRGRAHQRMAGMSNAEHEMSQPNQAMPSR